MLQGVSNLLFKHYQNFAGDFAWVSKFVNNCTNKDLIEDLRMLAG